MPTLLKSDPFGAVLLSSESLVVSNEQRDRIREILRVSCSDSAFATKAYNAIEYVLVAGSVKPVTVTSLNPSTAVLGSPSFDLHVMGANFDQFSVINFAGHDEPTTFVSDKELTTGVNMDVWHGPDVLPVYVTSPSGVASDLLPFEFTESGGVSGMSKHAFTQKGIEVPSHKQEPKVPVSHIEVPPHVEPHT